MSFDHRRILLVSTLRDDTTPPTSTAQDRLASGTWRCRLEPLRATGTIGGRNPLGDSLDPAGTDDRPGMVITHAEMPIRLFPRFFRYLVSSADAQHGSPGLLASFAAGSFGLGGFSGFTVSCWRRLGNAVEYAYQDPTHRAAMTWSAGQPSLKLWFARLAVVDSDGRLAGRNPFSGLRPGAATEDT
jgi:hypothetical protein